LKKEVRDTQLYVITKRKAKQNEEIDEIVYHKETKKNMSDVYKSSSSIQQEQ